MTRDRGDDEPRAFGDALASVSRELGLPSPSDIGGLLGVWPDIVGASVAPHAVVRSVRGGVLTVEVDDAPWATQLRYLEADLLAALDARLDGRVVTSVRIVVVPGGGENARETPPGDPLSG